MTNEEIKNSKAVKHFIQLLHTHRYEVNSILIYAFFGGLISLSVPLGIQVIVNLIQGAQISTSWIVLVVMVSISIVVAGFLMIMQQVVSENIQQKIFINSAFDFAYRIPKFKTESVDQEYVPELVNRFFDTIIVQKGVSKILLEYSMAVLQIIFGLILLMFYHPFFISFGAILIFITYFIIKYTFARGLTASIKESEHKYELVHWLEELGRAMKTFKLTGVTTLPLDKTDRITTQWIKSRKEHFKILLIQFISMVAFKALIAAGLLIIGGLLVINQQMNIGQFVAAEIVILMILASVEKLITGSETFFDVLTSIGKLDEIVEIPLEGQGEIILQSGEPGLKVDIKNMSFGFEGELTNTLTNINLRVPAGEKIGIVGYQGSGKSVLLDIIAGLYPEKSHAVTYNGFPLGSLSTGELRGLIGNNLRGNRIFKGTIYENISMGKKEIPLDEVIKACDQIDLTSYIQSLPHGYDTVLLSEGDTLPQGIRLKIILARCIAEMPKLILLEDSLGQLEAPTRNKFSKYILDKDKGWTVIAVSTDPSILEMMDRVVVMNKGEIVIEGKFDELRKNGGAKEFFDIK